MQAYEGMVDWLHSFLTPARDETDSQLYVAAALTRDRGPGSICVEGWVGGSRPNPDVRRRDNLSPLPVLEPRILGSLRPSLVLY